MEHHFPEDVTSVLPQQNAGADSLATILGESTPMQRLRARMQRLLQAEHSLTRADLPAVLITGETGVGKQLVARALHDSGPRQRRAFVEINCATLPEPLLEAELFGYEPGAYTGAQRRKPGLFEAADGGTVFLDEIGDLAPAMQAKLLKILEDRVVRRLGSLCHRKVDVRFIAATNQPLEQLVQQGTFRADLYFRLRIIHLDIPPLRQRQADVLLLARHFLRQLCQRYGKSSMRFNAAAEAALQRHSWPGNVRELRNVIEQTVLLSPRACITPEQLPLLPLTGPRCSDAEPHATAMVLPPQGICLERVKCDLVQQALQRTAGNVTRAARLLGMSRDALRYRITKYQLKC